MLLLSISGISGQEAPIPPAQPAPQATSTPAQSAPEEKPGDNTFSVSEEELRQQLVGKPLFLRGGYQGDSLSFTEHGDPIGHPSVGSYTLSAVQIEKVRLTKHRVELEGARYALHFLGALPSEDPSKSVDRIKITPKKKVLKISIDRERVIKSKKVKEPKQNKKSPEARPATAKQAASTSPAVASSETDVPQSSKPTPPSTPTPSTAVSQPAASQSAEAAEAEGQLEKDDAPGEPQAADQASVTTTISPAHAAKVLHDALDRIFAPSLDERLLAQMPEFWQLYYRAQAKGTDYRTGDPNVLRSSTVDQQAKVTSSIAPDSNEFAQTNGIAGRALYRAVIGADGKVGEIAAIRPIGFGLDENAVAAIRKASFQPATKNGQPVAETLDLAVVFRIFSNRTAVSASDTQATDPAKASIKPGPYSVNQPKPEPKTDSAPAPDPK